MDCEVCGQEEGPFQVIIEGAKLHACGRCARMGKIVSAPPAPRAAPRPGEGFAPRPAHGRVELELVEGFGDTIRNARLKMHLPLAVLAERIAEKESFLERIEHNKARPDIPLARRLEKELGVALLEESGEVTSGAAFETAKSRGTTLGDILEIELAKKRKKDASS